MAAPAPLAAAPRPWQRWGWALAGLLGGGLAAAAVRLPLATLPLVGRVTFAEDNAARAWAVLGCAAAAGLCGAARWFRAALWGNGLLGGLLLASGLEKFHDYQAMRAAMQPPPGAGDLARQSAAMTARLLAGVRPEAGGFLLLAGCLLGTLAAFAGSRAEHAGGAASPSPPPADSPSG